MNALPIIIGSLCVIAISYRYYSAFIAAKVLALDDSRPMPSHTMNDGHNYYPTSKWVLFGHHFAAISGAGPLVGPVLAAQFGFLPGLLWLVIGVCLGGAVHDFVILVASVRRKGKSLAEIARTEISPLSGVLTGISILFIVVIALFIAVIGGGRIAESALAPSFTFSESTITYMMAAYGFIASVLPVWMLLAPRDYLSSFMKLGTVAFLIVGVIIVAPRLHMPAATPFVAGGGPIIPGKLFPFVFITIACGAISGFHSLISSGTTPKMLDKETHARMIGYGSMLLEGLVGVVALIAATSLMPGDYFSINVDRARTDYVQFVEVNSTEGFDLHEQKLEELTQETGEKNLRGRTGGAVTLAVGIAQIFNAIPGLRGLMKYWYHFAIMFEALFILTTIDAGTRVARFMVGEFLGRVYKPLERPDWMPGAVITSALVVAAWAYFIRTGSVSTIWPMFGIANQLLAAIALCVGTTVIINSGRAKYAWVTITPLIFVATTTLTAGWRSIFDNFWRETLKPETAFRGYLNTSLTAIMMTCVVIVLIDSVLRWRRTLRSKGDRDQTTQKAA